MNTKPTRLFAALLLTSACLPVNAANYWVTGLETGVSVGSDALTASLPQNPAFTGQWNIDILRNAAFGTWFGEISGQINFEPYVLHLETATGLRTDMSYEIANYKFDKARMPYVPGALNLDSTSTIPLTTTSGRVSCSNSGLCFSHVSAFDSQLVDLTLTFDDASLSSFHGTVVALQDTAAGFKIEHTWSFTGVQAVPVPAAVWMLGSALLGLAGIARRRSRA